MIADQHLRLKEVTADDLYFSQATDAFFKEVGLDSIFVKGTDFSTGKLERKILMDSLNNLFKNLMEAKDEIENHSQNPLSPFLKQFK